MAWFLYDNGLRHERVKTQLELKAAVATSKNVI